ncbi:hypothetical protein PPACK8108_LOCUS5162 [Phakopsora pachyrhizi]|uniref:Kinetochore protein Sos7 coiled-coil domain-containing protein n=1 Tax=Phakopsora pachyrhizi TaxID=170000 RepID=A0AAV0AQD0_PHAPC|nr:hypothetical protein PPACK8108_LOCUS5162 [Phakopsora pachyrhizi]
MDELDQITSILDEFQTNKLYSLELRRDLIIQESSFDTSQDASTDDDPPESVEHMQVDGKLLSTLEYDLKSYHDYLSAVEFNWIEAAAKEKFISTTLLSDDGLSCSDQDIQELEKENFDYERAIKSIDSSIEEQEAEILQMTRELEDRYTSTLTTYRLSRTLTNDIADLKLELNELKLNQNEDDSELMTIAEASEKTATLERQMFEMSNQLTFNNEEIPKLKSQYAKESKLVDQLRSERNAIEKAEGDRRRTLSGRIRGGSLAKLESGRNWFLRVTETYKASLGIISIGVSGPNLLEPSKLEIKFSLRHPLTGTLIIEFNETTSLGVRKISNAYVSRFVVQLHQL